jgi:pimeloyl-ACP methyl ester carboxylesterase
MASAVDPPIQLNCREAGSGPPVVLLHGLGGSHTVWNELIAPLAEEFRVLVPDLRGHGQSPNPPGSTYSFPEMAGDVERLLDDHQLPNAHLVGLSAGGYLALYEAVHSPTRVRSLVLISSAGHAEQHTRGIVDRWATTLRDDGFDAYALRLLKDLYYPDWIEAHLDYADEVREQLRGADLRGTAGWAAATKTYDLRGRLGKLRLPTLIIQGMDDAVVDSSHARLLRQTIPGAELKLLAQTGHMVPIERPVPTLEALRPFLRAAQAKAANRSE